MPTPIAADGADEPLQAGGTDGEASGAEEPGAASAEDPEPDAGEQPGGPALGKPTDSAQRFSTSFWKLLALEARAQTFEQNTLGALGPSTLRGDRLDRFRRITRDGREWAKRLSTVTKSPLAVPSAREATRDLLPLESVVLSRLTRAVEASRDPRRLNPIENDIQAFMETENWVARDRAVENRDALIEREQLWADLVNQGQELVLGTLPPEELSSMLATLGEISPETAEEDSLVERLVTDQALQAKVLAELNDLMEAPSDDGVPEETDAELLDQLAALQADLIERSGLTETLAQTIATDQELTKLEERLADRGVNALTPEQRAKAQSRKAELMVERNTIRQVWNATEPDPQAAQLLRTTQDKLIRRRMFDLGPQAALFGHRYDMLLKAAQDVTRSPARWWEHLEAQSALVSALDEARPAPSPLEGLDLTTVPIPSGPIDVETLVKPLPKPKSKGKGKGGKQKQAGGDRP